ncbi:hypothetical protein U6V59_12440, partial [Cutibacterium acnes]
MILFDYTGTIQAFDGDAAAADTLMTYEAGEWYHMRLEMDAEARMYDLYMNGKLMANDYAFRNPNSSGVSKLRFFSNAAAGIMHLDNVRVISETDAALAPGPGELPEVILSAPEEALAGETFQAGLSLAHNGYDAKAERVVVTYDETVFTFEGIQEENGSGGSGKYEWNDIVPGTVVLTRSEQSRAASVDAL